MSHRNRNAFTKRDRNHGEILEALEKAGVQVRDLSHVGDGVPDLLVQHCKTRALVLIEVKDGDKKRGDLTKKQIEFRKVWPVTVVCDVHEALAACGVETFKGKKS